MISTRRQIMICLFFSFLISFSGCISSKQDETPKNEEQISIPRGWGNTTHLSFILNTSDRIPNYFEAHQTDIYIKNNFESLSLLIILRDEDFDEGDEFSIYFDCIVNASNYFRHEDVKRLKVITPNENERSCSKWQGIKGDDQYLSVNKKAIEYIGNGTGMGYGFGQGFGMRGEPDNIYNGTTNFNASYNHTNPIENMSGDYSVEFTIPLIGETYEGIPIDLVAKIGDTIYLMFKYSDIPIGKYNYGYYEWNYTLQ